MADCKCFKEVLDEINEEARWDIMIGEARKLKVEASDVRVEIAGIDFTLSDLKKTMRFCPWCGKEAKEVATLDD